MLTRNQIRRVKAFDAEWRKTNGINSRTVRYVLLEKKANGEIDCVTVAVKHEKKTGNVLVKDVARTASDGTDILMRDMGYYGGAGWIVYWDEWDRERGSCTSWDVRGKAGVGQEESWETSGLAHPESSFPFAWDPIVNLDLLSKTKFRYCGFKPTCACSIANWLKLYKTHPRIELLGKAGLSHLVCKSILKRMEADKGFMRFVSQNLEACKEAWPRAVTWAYVHGKTVAAGMIHERCLGKISPGYCAARFPKEWRDRVEKVVEHAEKTGIDVSEYARYASDAKAAGWDCSDDHVIFPRKESFKYLLEKAEADRREIERKIEDRKARSLNRTLKKTASVYSGIAKIECPNGLSAFVPTRKSDFTREGDAMGNCVGGMGYDRKMATGKSVLVFIRKNGKPFVDVEIDIDRGVPAIRQCYGQRNSKPSEEAVQVANEALKIVRRKVREMKKAKASGKSLDAKNAA